MSDPTVDAIGNARRRLVASILGYAEKELYPSLTLAQQQAFRAKVLQSVGSFADFAIDLLRAQSNQGAWVNEDVLELLRQINEQVLNRDFR